MVMVIIIRGHFWYFISWNFEEKGVEWSGVERRGELEEGMREEAREAMVGPGRKEEGEADFESLTKEA